MGLMVSEGPYAMSLTTYTDADHAGCQDLRRSTSGSAQFLGDRLVAVSSSLRLLEPKRTIESRAKRSSINLVRTQHPSETMVFHNEDGNPARANIKQALGYLKDGDGDGNSQFLRCQVTNSLTHGGLLRWRVAQEASCFILELLKRSVTKQRFLPAVLNRWRVSQERDVTKQQVLLTRSVEHSYQRLNILIANILKETLAV
ncbi:hypothetical protein Tco_0613501 [Tanacetum coccineum]